MSVLDREELLAVIEQHGATAPGLVPHDAGDAPGGAPRVALVNPTCGDRVDLALAVQDGKALLRGTASGCTLSRASASLLAATLRSMPPGEAADLLGVLVRARASGRPLERSALPDPGTFAPDSCAEPLMALAELAVAPLRRRCILLPWTAAQTLLEAGPPRN